MRVNAFGTQRLAAAAAAAGVARFTLLSTVKVNGENTTQRAFTPADDPQPQGAYAMSKWGAERYLTEVAASSRMQGVIVRSPLVYGPGVRANFLRLMQWIDSGWPLPLAAVRNRRSLVSIWNLCDLLVNVTRHPAAPGQVWMVADDEDLSTPELVVRLGRALGRRVRLLPVPLGVMRVCAATLHRHQELARLCDSLVVDASHTRAALRWSAPLTVEEGLARTAAWYRAEAHR
jgi:UDP-glucose 4-epimerase